MMKTVIAISMLLAVASSTEFIDFQNNIIEYEDVQPVPAISFPYPYQGHNQLIVEPMPTAHIYSNTKGNVIVPASTEVTVSSGFVSTAISCVYDAVKAVFAYLLSNGPALIAGTAFALGVCKLTPLCNSEVTIYEAQTELRSLATPERLGAAANFVRDALKKYNDMQKNHKQ